MKLRPLLALLLAACAHTGVNSSHKYVMLLGANHAGGQTVAVNGTERTIDYEYNDRGRGPKTHTVVSVDGYSIPRSELIVGNDYFKAAVTERLQTTRGRAMWSNGAEADAADAGPFYVSMYGPPEELAILARALLAAPQLKLPLLPAGEASLRKAGERTVAGQHLTCYEIAGLGFTPSPIWLDDANELFASVSSWSSLIRAGHESAAEELIKSQDEWREAAVKEAAQRLTHVPSGGGLVITNARLFDPGTLTTTPDATIVIRGNTIEAAGVNVAAPAEFEHLDAGGRFVMPGLWDMHVHLSDEDGFLNIANGVTSVRDMANDTDFLLALRKKFDSGEAVGPRVVLAGIIDGPGPLAGPTRMLADTEAKAREIVAKYADLGYEQIKIYSSVKPELVPVIARAAHERGLRVSGHVPAFMLAQDAVRAGYDEIQHANMLFLNFMPDVQDTRTPARFTSVAERAATIDLQSEQVRRFIDLLREHKTVIDPTVTIFEGMFTARKGTMSPSYAAAADRLPPQVRRGFLAGGLPVPDALDERYRQSFTNVLGLVKRLHDNGIPIVAGTDGLAGFTLQRELENYVAAGIPAPEVLRIATLGAARVMKHDDRLGTIAPGKLADLIVIDGDPAANISDIRRVVTVIKDGKVMDARAVASEVGVR